MIHYTHIWEEVAFIWKVTGKAVAIFMTGTVTKVLKICPNSPKGWLGTVRTFFFKRKRKPHPKFFGTKV